MDLSIKQLSQLRRFVLATLALLVVSLPLITVFSASPAYADTPCPTSWTGTYPDCVPPDGSVDVTPRDLKIAGFVVAAFLGWVTVRAFRFRRDG